MKVGDRIIYTRDNWMGGIESGAEEIPGYISKINLVQGAGDGDLLLYDLVREIDGKRSELPLTYGVFESEIKEIVIPKICGTCRFWNFKSSSEKAWGQCLNDKTCDSIYISTRFSDKMKTAEEYHQFMEDVRENCQVYFEENSFGCIYWEYEEEK